MAAADKGKIVGFEEVTDHITAETNTQATFILSPSLVKIARIGPQQITGEFFISCIQRTRNTVDLVQRLQVRTESAMHAEDLLVDHCRIRQRTEGLTHL